MLLVAFGQQKMFKNMLPAILHLFVYVGFLVINIEVLEFIVDGVAGTHRAFAPFLGGFYNVLMNIFEFLAVTVLLACVVFLFRRNVTKVERFHKPEMKKWPFLDANIILFTEIILMLAILNMNAADQVLQLKGAAHYPQTGTLFFSAFFMPLYESVSVQSLIGLERFYWWIHIIGILAFMVYVTYSKHLHIFMAFPNTYYGNLKPAGEIENMEAVTNEVKLMLGLQTETPAANPDEIGRFGAKDVNDLSWKSIMDSFTCTECGRCTAECPANQTGKKLSPRKIMMDTRDRLEEVGRLLDANGGKWEPDGKQLLDDYISREELWACTSCNACVQACPVSIDPLSIIMDMRQYLVMEQSAAPSELNVMMTNIENNGAPWPFNQMDRLNWKQEV
jgi:heterodisulfide reductase subunit C